MMESFWPRMHFVEFLGGRYENVFCSTGFTMFGSQTKSELFDRGTPMPTIKSTLSLLLSLYWSLSISKLFVYIDHEG